MAGTLFMLYAIYLTHPQDNVVLGSAPKHAQCVALKREVNLEVKPDALECIEVTPKTLDLYLEDSKFWKEDRLEHSWIDSNRTAT
jgi:hypothetical protein